MKTKASFFSSFLRKAVYVAFVLQAWCFHSQVYAQSTAANAGKEFYITYLPANSSPTLQLKVVVEQACYITAKYNNQLNAYWNNWNNTLVQPGIYTDNVTLADVVESPAPGTDATTDKTITLTSSADVCVYAINYVSTSTDATCFLPVPVWGTEYRLATGPPGANYGTEYAVVANENNTVVTTHTGALITLNKNQVYHFRSVNNVDMTGLKVSATKPVAVFSGAFACVTNGLCSLGGQSGDHTYEQLWSIDKWGKEFFAFPMATPGGSGNWGGRLAIVADENGTNVTLTGGINGGTPLNYTLNAGGVEYLCYAMSGLTKITSNKSIMVFLVLPDPTVTTIPPIDQRIQHAVIAPFIISGTTNINQHGIDILLPAAYWSQTVITHNGLDSTSYYTVNTSADFPDWYHVRRNLGNIDIVIDITSPGGFLAYVNGSGNVESYAILAGTGAYNLQNYFTIQEKATTVDTYYANTTDITHTFDKTDNIVVKRTIESPFTSVTWLINGVLYPITENNSISMNTLNFPASALSPGENFITMSVRYSSATADSLYTGSVWLTDPCSILDWIRLDSAINKQSAPVITIYKHSSGITEDLPNGIMVLCQEEDFINSNGTPINVNRTVTLRAANPADSVITLYTPGIINDNKRHFIVSGGNFTVENMILDGSFNGSQCAALNDTTASGGGITAHVPLTLKNTSIQYCYTDGNGGAIFAGNTLTLQDTVIIAGNIADKMGGGIYKDATGNFITSGLDSLLVTGNTAITNQLGHESGGGINTMADLTFLPANHVTISDNKALGNGYGGGINVLGASLTLTGVTLQNNSADNSGAFIVRGRDKSTDAVIINGTTVISNNIATNENGGFSLHDVTAEISGQVLIKDNEAVNNTGGFSIAGEITGSAVDIFGDVKITGNRTALVGGGLLMGSHTIGSSVTDVSIRGNVEISNNHAGMGGGGITVTVEDGATTLLHIYDSVKISNNTSDFFGGGIIGFNRGGNAQVAIHDSVRISGNEAIYGGGISAVGVPFALYDGVKITGNIATMDGGAIYLLDHTELTVGADVVFSGNTAADAYDLDKEIPDWAYHPDALLAMMTVPGVPITVDDLKTLHGTAIQTANFSLSPNNYLYNNYDVNFVGDSCKMYLKTDSATIDQTVCVLSAIDTILYLGGINMIGSAVNGLPTGVTGVWHNDTLEISGAPAADGIFTLTISGTGGCSAVLGTLTVLDCQIQLPGNYMQVPACFDSIVFDVLANDTIIPCDRSSIVFTLTSGSKVGAVTTVMTDSIVYSPVANFTGFDTLTYQVACVDTVYLGTVYITVVECPDNIDDADCVGTPPSGQWSFMELMNSAHTGIETDNSCIPLVGDIDNDGKTEIIVLGKTFQTQYSDSIHIFKVDNDMLVLQQSMKVPAINRVNNPYAIAKVDGNDYASLFFCTSHYAGATTSVTNGANARQLMKYIYNPSTQEYEFAWQQTYSARTDREMGQPVIVDFNGDGIPEVLVLDKVFNARTGALLVDGGHLANNNNGFGFGGHVITVTRWVTGAATTWSSIMAVGDIDGDGVPEVIGGKTVYKVTINNPNTQDGTNHFDILRHVDATGHPEAVDGPTALADMTGDGQLDVIVTGNMPGVATSSVYVWNPRTGKILHNNAISNIPRTSNEHSASVPFIGDIDGDTIPEICLSGQYKTRAYNLNAGILVQKWDTTTNDGSCATGITMFDFDQTGTQKLVYRDMTHLRILNGSDGSDWISPINCTSATANEYPIVADVNGDQAAEIVVTSGTDNGANFGTLRIYGSSSIQYKWAPSRKVWNQYAYNVVNINEDLTVPAMQMNPATFFPNGTQPYNAYLQQQTMLDKQGDPLWLLPDVAPLLSESYLSMDGNAMNISLRITNLGDAAIGTPVYIAMYKDNKVTADTILTVAVPVQLNPGDSTTVTFAIPDVTLYQLNDSILIRINDNGLTFPIQEECDTTNNVYVIPLMKKNAYLNGSLSADNGRYGNPVSVLFSDVIEYKLKAVNSRNTATPVQLVDTLPLYLKYIESTPTGVLSATSTVPPRDIVNWNLGMLSAGASQTVSFKAEPIVGVCISQPMFINRAWVRLDYAPYPTNETYHQGAGAGYVTFLASLGGSLFNADMQAVDYSLTPKSGVVIVPDEGYRFAGWSHDDYISLRGETIPAKNGIMRYDTLKIYGHVTLRANFVPDENPVRKGDETVNEQPSTDETRIWAVGNELFIRTSIPNSIVRIYSMDGVLQMQRIILQTGETKIQLSAGLYVVTLNDSIGKKVTIFL